jgi:hypothetical protein
VGKNLGLVDDAQLHGEIVYDRGQKKSIDWFLIFYDLVVFVEVKSARLALGARAADAGLLPALQRSIGSALGQIERSVTRLRAKDPAFSHIPHDRPIVGPVITAEPFYTANRMSSAPCCTRRRSGALDMCLRPVASSLVRTTFVRHDAFHSRIFSR